MNAEQLTASILKQAIEGKLVPQIADEGVVEQIGAAPEEVPFKIPESWKWVQLKSIGQIIGGGTPKTAVADYWNGDISWITPADLGKNSSKWILKGEKSITQKGLDESSAKLMPEGSVVYSSRAPIGHIAISAHELCTNQGCKSFAPDAQFITTEWAYYMLIARTKDIQSRASGTTFKEISGKGVGETWVSLPPIAEQQRIVAKIEELLSLVEAYGKSYDRLQELNAELPKKLKASILQEAIQGKLVPQLAAEGVVEQIGAAPEEVPFEIPESWKWVQLKSIGQIIGGGTPKTSVADYWNGDISWITPADLGKNTSKWILKGAKSITQKGLDESSAKLMPEGSIIYSSRAPIGHIAIAAHELCTNQGCKSFVPDAQFITTEWAYYMLIARTRDIQSRASGTTFKEISGKGVGETWVSLPPIAEQQRIVAKVEELLKQVDTLSA